MKEGSWAFWWPRDKKGISWMDAGVSGVSPAGDCRVNLRVETLRAGKKYSSALFSGVFLLSLPPFLLIPFEFSLFLADSLTRQYGRVTKHCLSRNLDHLQLRDYARLLTFLSLGFLSYEKEILEVAFSLCWEDGLK